MSEVFLAGNPERSLPLGIAGSIWARAIWHRKHHKGPILIVYRLDPLPIYVAGWISWGGSRCIPQLVGGFVEEDRGRADTRVESLGKEIFVRGPTDELIERSAEIAKKYAENGGKRPSAPKSKSADPDRTLPKAAKADGGVQPCKTGYSFRKFSTDDRVFMCGPDPDGVCGFVRCPVSMLSDDWEGKSLSWWTEHGLTETMIAKFRTVNSRKGKAA